MVLTLNKTHYGFYSTCTRKLVSLAEREVEEGTQFLNHNVPHVLYWNIMHSLIWSLQVEAKTQCTPITHLAMEERERERVYWKLYFDLLLALLPVSLILSCSREVHTHKLNQLLPTWTWAQCLDILVVWFKTFLGCDMLLFLYLRMRC